MSKPTTTEPTFAPVTPGLDGDGFYRRLRLLTLSLLLLWLVIYFLREYKLIFQPLLVAIFIGYLILPVHNWLVGRGVPALAAYVVILACILGLLFGVGTLVFQSFEKIIDRLPGYEAKLDGLYQKFLEVLEVDGSKNMHLRDLGFIKEMGTVDQVMSTAHAAVGTFASFFMGLAVTFVYLIFLMAERESLYLRMGSAFGDKQTRQIMEVAGTINRAISQYLSIKTFIGFLAAVLSMIVLASFNVDFFILWGILIFLLNYIPYLGSLTAVILPIALAFLQLESIVNACLVGVLLIAIQQVTGTFLEPRMAGRRLDLSPLLILLSLSFWGLIWGVVGMILAVPLLVAIKAVLENIEATRPLARLLSNQG